MSKVVRSVKNVTKGYSAVEVKVRNGMRTEPSISMQVLRRTATSNDPWGPVGSDMAEIAQITFNKYATSPKLLTAGAHYDWQLN